MNGSCRILKPGTLCTLNQWQCIAGRRMVFRQSNPNEILLRVFGLGNDVWILMSFRNETWPYSYRRESLYSACFLEVWISLINLVRYKLEHKFYLYKLIASKVTHLHCFIPINNTIIENYWWQYYFDIFPSGMFHKKRKNMRTNSFKQYIPNFVKNWNAHKNLIRCW